MAEADLENKSREYENSRSLAEALTDELLLRYDLNTGMRIEDQTGVEFDGAMDFWNSSMRQAWPGIAKPQSREELVSVFEEVINQILADDPDKRHYIDGAYGYYVSKDGADNKAAVHVFKTLLGMRFKSKFGRQSELSKDNGFGGWSNTG